jgi:hypothetical protein
MSIPIPDRQFCVIPFALPPMPAWPGVSKPYHLQISIPLMICLKRLISLCLTFHVQLVQLVLISQVLKAVRMLDTTVDGQCNYGYLNHITSEPN